MSPAAPISTRLTDDPSEAARMLLRGELVAFPTETVYGLGANALSADAVARIFDAKQRPRFDPLIVHIPHSDVLTDVVSSVPEAARRLANSFWPGPLTMVLPRAACIPDLVTAGLSTVGIRVPDHPVAIELLRIASIPVAAPSANPFGSVSPTTAEHVINGLGGRIHAILDGGPCRVGLESTIVSFAGEEPVVLRLGGLPIEDIMAVTGPIDVAQPDPRRDDSAQPAPGMLSRHYAPRTPVILFSPEQALPQESARAGLLTWGETPDESGFEAVRNLSPAGDLVECAANFFAALRSLDSLALNVIMARGFPDHGLGRALNDRLRRATGMRFSPSFSLGST